MPTIDIRQQPIDKVVLFSSRAEIKRSAKVLLEAGEQELVVTHLAREVIQDSFRVQGVGNAIILDVVHDEVPALTSEAQSDKEAEIRERLETAKTLLNQSNNEISTEEDVIEAIKKAFNEGVTSNLKKHPEGANDVHANLSTVDTLLNNYFERLAAKKNDLDTRRKANELLKEEVNKIQNELNNVVNRAFDYGARIKIAKVSLEVAEPTEVTFDFIYQVYNAGWTASYDVRVDETQDKNTLRLVYYGTIEQHTGEDWNDVPVTLSTASPELGGSVPELGTLEASIYKPPKEVIHEYSAAPMMMMARCEGAPAFDGYEMTTRVVENVQKTALSIEFNVEKNQTIPNETKGKKLTIGDVELGPSLVHETVPSKRSVAFLTATAKNTSKYSFAAGPANIFFNNAFIAKSEVKDVSPGERFTVSLGVDTAVKVTYKPAKKYNEQAGVINKVVVQAHEQNIEIKNTHNDRPVLVKVLEQIPRSTDQKIKIKLVHPTAGEKKENAAPAEGSVLNDGNNLEWTVAVPASEAKNLNVKWTIEYPNEEEITYDNKY